MHDATVQPPAQQGLELLAQLRGGLEATIRPDIVGKGPIQCAGDVPAHRIHGLDVTTEALWAPRIQHGKARIIQI